MKFGALHQILNPITVTWPKIEIFKIQDGGGRHLEYRFFGHNSSTDCPISAKFCMRKQNGMLAMATCQKLQIFKIQDDGRPPFWKSLNHHISVNNRTILMKFGTLHQILNPITVTWPKLKFLKFKMAAVIILKIAFFALTHRPIVRFQRNFVWESRMVCRRRLRDKNYKFLKSKIADGRHFDNRLLAIFQSKIVWFWWNLVHYIRYWTRLQSRDQKLKFLKFKMAAAAI